MYSKKLIMAAALATAIVAGAGIAHAMFQDSVSAELRATGKVGEQADGYLGVVGAPTAEIRSKVNAVNIKRRAYYTEIAQKRNAKIEEVGAATACEIFASRIQAGQYYRLSDGVWRQREAGETVQRPPYCG
jgi:uncharacterized protein YdbL (DUF1318 family)